MPRWQRILEVGVLSALFAGAFTHTAGAALGPISATPRVTTAGSTVDVSGAGCAGTVRLVGDGFAFPGGVSTPIETTFAAGMDGRWSTSVPMPSVPTALTATCLPTGEVSPSLVVAPSDHVIDSLLVRALPSGEWELTTSPLVAGSDFSVFTSGGSLVATTVVVGTTGVLRLPGSAGPGTYQALALRGPAAGIALPAVPKSFRIDIPNPVPSINVLPRVATTGTTITASGNCSGDAVFTVRGQPAGWFDQPPLLVQRSPQPDPSGAWQESFPMPPLPSVVTIACTKGGSTTSNLALISPNSGVRQVMAVNDVVHLPSAVSPEQLEAFSASGAQVALGVVAEANGGLSVALPPGPTPPVILFVGIESLGENAEALQNSRVQAWRVDQAGPAISQAASATAVADRLSHS